LKGHSLQIRNGEDRLLKKAFNELAIGRVQGKEAALPKTMTSNRTAAPVNKTNSPPRLLCVADDFEYAVCILTGSTARSIFVPAAPELPQKTS
jgi:hypothetical protein